MWVLETDKAVALRLGSVAVADHLGFDEGGVAVEGSGQRVIIDIVAQVPTEYTEVICGGEEVHTYIIIIIALGDSINCTLIDTMM